MDSLMKFYRWLRGIAKLFRFVELCLCFGCLWWFSAKLPFAVRISGDYFRRTLLLLFSPVSVFLLGNAIVVTLLVKSGLFTGAASVTIDNAVSDFYEELRCGAAGDGDALPDEEVVFHDKEIICEEKKNDEVAEAEAEAVVSDVEEAVEEKVAASYRRSKSEKVRGGVKEEKLRRSETDVLRRSVGGEDVVAAATVEMTAEDAEDFRRTIEAFIAKQMRFHREERLAVVLHGQA